MGDKTSLAARDAFSVLVRASMKGEFESAFMSPQ